MSRYALVHSKIWQDEKFKSFSDEDRMLFLYLLTNPHGNLIGFYYLPVAYIAEDLGKDFETVREGLANLSETGLIAYDEQSKIILVKNHLKYNPLQNPNQAKGAAKLIRDMPKNPLVAAFLECVTMYCPDYANRFERVCKPFLNPCKNLQKPTRSTDPDPESVSSSEGFPNPNGDDDDDDSTEGETDDQFPSEITQAFFAAFGHLPNSVELGAMQEHRDADMPDELLLEAIRRAGERHARWPYADRILSNWARDGTITLAAVERADKQHETEKQTRGRDSPALDDVPADGMTPQAKAHIEALHQAREEAAAHAATGTDGPGSGTYHDSG